MNRASPAARPAAKLPNWLFLRHCFNCSCSCLFSDVYDVISFGFFTFKIEDWFQLGNECHTISIPFICLLSSRFSGDKRKKISMKLGYNIFLSRFYFMHVFSVDWCGVLTKNFSIRCFYSAFFEPEFKFINPYFTSLQKK